MENYEISQNFTHSLISPYYASFTYNNMLRDIHPHDHVVLHSLTIPCYETFVDTNISGLIHSHHRVNRRSHITPGYKEFTHVTKLRGILAYLSIMRRSVTLPC